MWTFLEWSSGGGPHAILTGNSLDRRSGLAAARNTTASVPLPSVASVSFQERSVPWRTTRMPTEPVLGLHQPLPQQERSLLCRNLVVVAPGLRRHDAS